MFQQSANSQPTTGKPHTCTSVIVRPATVADCPRISMMTWSVVAVTGRMDAYRFPAVRAGVHRTFDRANAGLYFLACDGDRVIGQLKLSKIYNDMFCCEEGWIQHVFIHPNFRGGGVYDQLHNKAVQTCREWRLPRLNLHVVDANLRAKRAYEKRSMQSTGAWMTQTILN